MSTQVGDPSSEMEGGIATGIEKRASRASVANADFNPLMKEVQATVIKEQFVEQKVKELSELQGNVELCFGETVQETLEYEVKIFDPRQRLWNILTLGIYWLVFTHFRKMKRRVRLILTDARVILKEEVVNEVPKYKRIVYEAQHSLTLSELRYTRVETFSPGVCGLFPGGVVLELIFNKYPPEVLPSEEPPPFYVLMIAPFLNVCAKALDEATGGLLTKIRDALKIRDPFELLRAAAEAILLAARIAQAPHLVVVRYCYLWVKIAISDFIEYIKEQYAIMKAVFLGLVPIAQLPRKFFEPFEGGEEANVHRLRIFDGDDANGAIKAFNFVNRMYKVLDQHAMMRGEADIFYRPTFGQTENEAGEISKERSFSRNLTMLDGIATPESQQKDMKFTFNNKALEDDGEFNLPRECISAQDDDVICAQPGSVLHPATMLDKLSDDWDGDGTTDDTGSAESKAAACCSGKGLKGAWIVLKRRIVSAFVEKATHIRVDTWNLATTSIRTVATDRKINMFKCITRAVMIIGTNLGTIVVPTVHASIIRVVASAMRRDIVLNPLKKRYTVDRRSAAVRKNFSHLLLDDDEDILCVIRDRAKKSLVFKALTCGLSPHTVTSIVFTRYRLIIVNDTKNCQGRRARFEVCIPLSVITGVFWSNFILEENCFFAVYNRLPALPRKIIYWVLGRWCMFLCLMCPFKIMEYGDEFHGPTGVRISVLTVGQNKFSASYTGPMTFLMNDDEDAIRRVISNLTSCQYQSSIMLAQGLEIGLDDKAVAIDVEAVPVGERRIASPRSAANSFSASAALQAPLQEEAFARGLKGSGDVEIEMAPIMAHDDQSDGRDKEPSTQTSGPSIAMANFGDDERSSFVNPLASRE